MALTKKQQFAFDSLKSAILAAAAGFVYAQAAEVEVFVKAGLVEVNTSMTDENGAVAVRLVAEAQQNAEATATASSAPKAISGVISGVEMPKIQRGSTGAGRSAIYPFDKLEVGQSFFVPASEDKPNVAKSLASTVTSANSRYAVEIEGTHINRNGREVPNTKQEREFQLRAVEDGAPWGFAGQKGAAVWRTL